MSPVRLKLWKVAPLMQVGAGQAEGNDHLDGRVPKGDAAELVNGLSLPFRTPLARTLFAGDNWVGIEGS